MMNQMWFHVEDYPSYHVFVENDSLTLEEIRQVSEMCKDTGSVLFKNIYRKIVINVS